MLGAIKIQTEFLRKGTYTLAGNAQFSIKIDKYFTLHCVPRPSGARPQCDFFIGTCTHQSLGQLHEHTDLQCERPTVCSI